MAKHQERTAHLDNIAFKKDVLAAFTNLKQFAKAANLEYNVVYRAANQKPITFDEKADVLEAYTSLSPDVIQMTIDSVKADPTPVNWAQLESIIFALQAGLEDREELWFLEGMAVPAANSN